MNVLDASLVHHVPNTCTICKSKFDGRGMCGFKWNMQDGCIFCPDCLKNGSLKSTVINSNMVPFGFVFKKDLKFYRKSKNEVAWGTCECVFVPMLHSTSKTKEFALRLFFNDSQRYVSLANIFKHNPEVYETFLKIDNLFGESIPGISLSIAAKDLSVANLDKIEHSKALADSTDFDKFDF